VRKGEHSAKVYYFKQLEIADRETEETKTVPMLREYTVFNVDQCEGEFAVRKFQRVMMRTWMAEIDLTENCGLVRYAIFTPGPS